LKKYLQQIGPGIITAALILGPGSLTLNIKLGAGYGFALWWVLILVVLFMLAYAGMATRLGISSQTSLISLIRERHGPALSIVLGLGIFLATSAFQAGNAVGAGAAIEGLLGGSVVFWILFFAVTACTLLFFKSFYRILEKLMIALVLVMLAAFLLTLILSQPSLPALVNGLVPRLPTGSEMLTLALVASSFSTIGAFYQSYLVREKGWKPAEAKTSLAESRNGIIILGLLSSCIMLCAGSILHEPPIAVNTPSDLGLALEPLFGPFTSSAFMVGFFAASFSSILGNATIGGVILADALGWGHELRDQRVRMLIMLVILLGASVAAYFGSFPLELIVFAQSITILIGPPIALLMLWLANDKGLMKNLKNSVRANVVGGLGLAVLLLLMGYYVYRQFIL
jgi:manganese transport protein